MNFDFELPPPPTDGWGYSRNQYGSAKWHYFMPDAKTSLCGSLPIGWARLVGARAPHPDSKCKHCAGIKARRRIWAGEPIPVVF